MREIEKRVAQWRQQWTSELDLDRERLDELESHLRDELERSLTPAIDDAWQRTVAKLGDPRLLAQEFAKNTPPARWLPARIVGFGAIAMLLLATGGLLPLYLLRGGDLLLGSHIFAVTLGYVATFLIGALGICFAAARPFAAWHAGRAAALRRVAVPLSLFALGCTALGVVLGMRWAAHNWGQAWAWDLREVGGLAVVIGNALLVAMLWSPWASDRLRMALAVFNASVVTLAWFHPLLGIGSGLSSYGHSSSAAAGVIIIALVLQVALAIAALAPPRWLVAK